MGQPGETLTADDVREMLLEACIKAGGQAAWAEEHGMSRQQVNNALKQGDSPGGAIARALGLRRNPYTWSLDR
jgi:DNA-binding phage protein